MVSTGIAKASVKRIAFEATGSPIGADAVDKLSQIAEGFIRMQAQKADKMAKHAGRKTIRLLTLLNNLFFFFAVKSSFCQKFRSCTREVLIPYDKLRFPDRLIPTLNIKLFQVNGIIL